MSDAIEPPVRFTLNLPAIPVSVTAARSLVRVLHPWLDPEQLERCELIVSEIVTNAIRHGTPTAHDTVELEITAAPGTVAGCVRDRGPAFRAPDEPRPPEQIGGFGLPIVQRLASSLSIERSPTGNQVRFSL